MGEYKVLSLMIGEPKLWRGPHGDVYYHSVNVEGHDKPLSVGKKEPNSIKAGDTIYGDITETDYIEDKFKASPPPQATGGSTGGDDRGKSIQASMIVKLAFQAFIQAEGMLPQEDAHWRQIDYTAEMLKKSIDKIEGIKDETATAAKVFDNKEPLPLPPEDLGNEAE